MLIGSSCPPPSLAPALPCLVALSRYTACNFFDQFLIKILTKIKSNAKITYEVEDPNRKIHSYFSYYHSVYCCDLQLLF